MAKPPFTSVPSVDSGNGRLFRLWSHRISPEGLIPPDARVDPAQFPEDEFLLLCPACNYELRGLTEQVCPECGRPFERGRLLVEQYVIEQGKRCHARNRLFRAAWWLSWTCLIAIQVGVVFVARRIQQNPFAIQSLPPATPWILGVLIFTSTLIVWAAVWQQSRRRKRVRHLIERVVKAMNRETPAFERARRCSRWLQILAGVAVAGLTIWVYREDHPGLNSSSRWSIPGVVVAALCLATAIAFHFRSRWTRRSD